MLKVEAFTIKEAIEKVPTTNDPSSVTDIVFQVGLNDHRKETYVPKEGTKAQRQKKEVREIQDKYTDMLFKYNNHFPNARMNAIGLPPISDSHMKINDMLHRLCNYTDSNYVDTSVFQDWNTGKLRSATMKDAIHYNEYGVKILAKEIRRNLYSTKNIGSGQLVILNMMASQ